MNASRVGLFIFAVVTSGALGAACTEERAAAPSPEAVTAGQPATFPCVHFGDLQKHLPKTLEGFKAIRDEGSSGKYGEVSISEAERVFTGADGQEISVRIVDTTLVDDLGRAIRAAARDGAGRDPNDPTAPIMSAEAVGFVRYDRDNQKAEANLLVADRFVVAVSSEGFEGTQEVRRIAEAIDITGLALLR